MSLVELSSLKLHFSKTVADALKLIDSNGQGVCFIVNDREQVVGILTDGDIRRNIINGFDSKTPVSQICKSDFAFLPIGVDSATIQKTLSKEIRHLPILDEDRKLIDYATSYDSYRIPVLEPNLNGNELNYLTECIKTNWISSKGKYVSKFESQFEEYCEMPHALATSNGTTALHLALEALGIGEGDEVIAPNLTFASTVNSIIYTEATPVLADIEEDTLAISVKSIRSLITRKTKAIIPVHLYGHPADMDPIMLLAKEFDLLVIEDCAEAVGSKYKGRPVGSFGDAAMFSFFGNKTITTGEGGMLLFKDKDIYLKAQILRDHGMSKSRRYWHEYIGYNYRMTNIQAAIGVAQMERLDEFVERKREIAELYKKGLTDLPINCPVEREWAFNSYWLYTIIFENEIDIDTLITQLLYKGIETRPIFFPIGDMPPYIKYDHSGLRNSKRVGYQGISLPSSPNLSNRDVVRVIEVFRNELIKYV